MAFATVTEEVVRHLSGARAADLTAVLDRHRRLVEGTGLGAVLDLVGHCHVLAPTGRVVAGPPPADPAALARAFLTAPRLPHHVPALDISVLPVGPDGTPRAADWFIALDGDAAGWPEERHALAGELAAIVALERARLRAEDRSSQEIVDAAFAGDPVAPGRAVLPRRRRRGLDGGAAASGRAAHRPGRGRPRAAAGGRDGGRGGRRARPGHRGGRRRRRPGRARLPVPRAAGGRHRRPASATAPGASGLRGAIEEARYARRLAATRPAPVRVVRHDELATHVLLLASVPDDVRQMFRVRLLDPLRDYDEVHGSDLVRTLETFLQNSGSWTRCAEQLHLHVNSVRYRIQRIQDLTGRDLSRLEDRVDFFLALRLS
ncbi:PucR family transcriptional regulator [Actinomadura madurae]|uniref:PucR family transcriptional regulator n=1 Tax=Actinomadura madurae TaxID=1993 RepID=UPI0020D23AE1|nr:helix-turn-helix domain-containing protein [Actinomadura madurae]MCP9983428.1 helix-turn-helix domain-containing protein [Actinomadura madurae]